MVPVFRKELLQSEMPSLSHFVQALALGFRVIPAARNGNRAYLAYLIPSSVPCEILPTFPSHSKDSKCGLLSLEGGKEQVST